MADTLYSGRCLCGDLRYTVNRPPIWVGHCHCESCRRHTGSAMASFVGVAADSFSVARGALSSYASSPGVRRSFCARCGTPLTYEADRFPGEVHVFLGTLDDPNQFRPEFHVHCAERIPWFEVSDTLPRYPGSSEEADHSDPES